MALHKGFKAAHNALAASGKLKMTRKRGKRK
jgi:hypothetical protein